MNTQHNPRRGANLCKSSFIPLFFSLSLPLPIFSSPPLFLFPSLPLPLSSSPFLSHCLSDSQRDLFLQQKQFRSHMDRILKELQLLRQQKEAVQVRAMLSVDGLFSFWACAMSLSSFVLRERMCDFPCHFLSRALRSAGVAQGSYCV